MVTRSLDGFQVFSDVHSSPVHISRLNAFQTERVCSKQGLKIIRNYSREVGLSEEFLAYQILEYASESCVSLIRSIVKEIITERQLSSSRASPPFASQCQAHRRQMSHFPLHIPLYSIGCNWAERPALSAGLMETNLPLYKPGTGSQRGLPWPMIVPISTGPRTSRISREGVCTTYLSKCQISAPTKERPRIL